MLGVRRATAQLRVKPCGLSREVVAFGEARRDQAASAKIAATPTGPKASEVTIVVNANYALFFKPDDHGRADEGH